MRFVICFIAAAFLLVPGPVMAQAFTLTTTNNPEGYVEEFLDDLVTDGIPPFRDFFTALGNTSPQLEATLAIVAKRDARQGKRHGKLIETVTANDALKQIYAFGFFGDNNWLFMRIDFVWIGNEWAISNYNFNSDYEAVIGPKFETAKVR